MTTKLRERKIRDFKKIKCTKEESSRLLVKDDEICKRWEKYSDNNTMIEHDDYFDDTNIRFFSESSSSEIMETLKKMKVRKAIGPYNIPIKVCRGM